MKRFYMPVNEAKGLVVDPLALLTMTYTVDGFNELLQDIKRNGQLVPIVLRDNKLLDGRHRHKACLELGIDVMYVEVGAISEEEALDLVISNSINKATGTDASKVEAYLMCKAKGLKQKEMPKMFRRLNANYINKLVFIEKENPEYLQALLKQNSVSLHNKKFDKLEKCGTINSIWRILKDNQSMDSSIVEVVTASIEDPVYDVYISDVMVNKAAVQEYWETRELMSLDGINIHPASTASKCLISLINHKHSGN